MNKKDRRVRFGVADVIIIMLILAVIGCAVWFFAVDSIFDGGKDTSITYEVRITNVKNEIASHIKLSDPVIDGVYGEAIGTVEDIKIEPYTEEILDKSGEEATPVNAEKEGYCNVYLKISTTAKEKDSVYLVADTEIRVGEPLHIQLPDFIGTGYCTAFSAAGEEG